MQMIGWFGVSLLLSGVVTWCVFLSLRWYYRKYVKWEDSLASIRLFMREIGEINVFLLLFIPLAFVIFFLLTKKYTAYFQQISQGIHHLANGDFTHQVILDKEDEFGEIATDINRASSMLQAAIARGDFSESSKNELVVNLAHDLRTPLTSVLGYLHLLQSDHHLTPKQQQHYLHIAHTKAERLERLIDTLFEVTRLNYGLLPLKKTTFDVGHLLLQLADEMYPIVEQAHLTIRTAINDPLLVHADGELLARVFENLLTNACRYGVDGQFIDITTQQHAETVEIAIINYGAVITERDLPHLFDMYYTADQARTTVENSSGIGLFIAKNIIEQHDGTIDVSSTIKETRFTIQLPCYAQA